MLASPRVRLRPAPAEPGRMCFRVAAFVRPATRACGRRGRSSRRATDSLAARRIQWRSVVARHEQRGRQLLSTGGGLFARRRHPRLGASALSDDDDAVQLKTESKAAAAAPRIQPVPASSTLHGLEAAGLSLPLPPFCRAPIHLDACLRRGCRTCTLLRGSGRVCVVCDDVSERTEVPGGIAACGCHMWVRHGRWP